MVRTRVIEAPIIPCELSPTTRQAIDDFAVKLKSIAPTIAPAGLSEQEFWDSGLFEGAIERLRGQRSAGMREKRAFVTAILNFLQDHGSIRSWTSSGSKDRHDYEVRFPDGRIAVIETKGCLDGNNTTIFERPAHADEFVIWSLCQNAAADPRHNVWSGIHTRLSADVMHRRERVDAVIVWDMVCGTRGRPCPKLIANKSRATRVEKFDVPPPCIYLFPRTIPDPRNNPNPPTWRLQDVRIAESLHKAFKGDENDLTEVRISADMLGASVRRRTTLARANIEIRSSGYTPIKRAKT